MDTYLSSTRWDFIGLSTESKPTATSNNIKGEMKGKELEEWKKWEQDKIQRQREFDAKYRTEHANEYKSNFYKLMEK